MDAFFNAENEPGDDEIENIASDFTLNAKILRGLRQFDLDETSSEGPPFEELTVVYVEDRGSFHQLDTFIPNEPLELCWFGYFLGKNPWIRKIFINASSFAHFELDAIELFFSGLSSNKSIVEFEMCWLRDARVTGSLGAFFCDNDDLLSLSMHTCELTVQGWRVLAQGLKNRSEKNIEYASFGVQEGFDSGDVCQIDDESVSEIIGSFESYSSLERLSIQQTRMGYKGCTALANLLDQPSSNIVYLDLDFNQIDDSSVDAMLPSLAKNGQLLHLGLRGDTISDRKLLDLHSLYKELDINAFWRNVNLVDVLARGNFGMEKLYEWDLKLLPNLAHLFDRAMLEPNGLRQRERYAKHRLEATFNFLRSVPGGIKKSEGVPAGQKKSERKRKEPPQN